jgi:LPS sulfotransferase NodH
MQTPVKKFCLMTMGRSGSTSLMNAIARQDDVMTPVKVFTGCPDHELLHPKRARKFARALSRLTDRGVRSQDALIEAFYRLRPARLIGFKSMPERHKAYADFVEREDIQFITLVRRDIVSTVASFMVARVAGTWRRDGGDQGNRWTFGPDSQEPVLGTLRYVLRTERMLRSIPQTIDLVYEELCDPDFSDARLDAYFGTRIALDDPKPPTDAATYVTNWSEYEAFVRGTIDEIGERREP